ncbi:MAG: T9SS type A sorting domain-containing protein [Candidatus Azobacteroides sp.]|nr:T9SS type A sorting domain-containing protein [Candidatus Azobacteroides sp.]
MDRTFFYTPASRAVKISLLVSFLYLFHSDLHAQLFRANTDNVFATPGAYGLITVLSNDELGDCTENDIFLEVIIPPTHGAIQLSQTSKVIRYIPATGWIGKDSLEYRINCSGNLSTAWVYINTNIQPDNMFPDACAITPPATSWEIEMANYSEVFVHDYAQPFVGDIDNDGETEIITFNRASINTSNMIYIFKPDLTLKHSFSIPLAATHGVYPLVIADIDRDGVAELIIASIENEEYKLHCYRHDGTPMWTSAYSYFKNGPNMATPDHNGVSLIIADINNDGYPEIVAGDRIFDAVTGHLLLDLPNDMPKGGMVSNSSYIYMPAMADFDNDGELEIACGSMVYKVELADRSASAYEEGKNNIRVLADVSSQLDEERKDGWVSVADIDGDGFLDVVVVNVSPMNVNTATYLPTMMYAWSPEKEKVLAKVIHDDVFRGSRAFIGDITGNGKPDIAFTYTNGMVAYRYDPETGSFIEIFNKDTSDSSGATTMSMFDFDLDGEVELVYRDETHLRILDKDGNNRVAIPCYSPTHTEYPVVVDIDNDDHADIIVSGSLDKIDREKIRLIHFRHPKNTWAKCRKVYNQFGFNPIYINEDLTIPQYPLNPATEFISKNGTKRIKPFNHFLQQVTDLNGEGETLYHGPDLYFDKNFQDQIIWDTSNDKLIITIGVNNKGSSNYNDNLCITTYLIDQSQNPYQEYLIGNVSQKVFVSQNTNLEITYEISGISAIMAAIPQYTHWEIRLNQNPSDGTFPADTEECLYYNNINNTISLTYGEHVMCQSQEADSTDCEWVKLFPQDIYDYYWFTVPDPANIAEAIHMGDSLMICKDASLVEKYYIQVWDKGSNRLLTGKMDTINVYLFPDSLIWTGIAEDQDWHNFENWHNPNLSIYPRGNIPRQCTNVFIPDVVSNYPDLHPSKTNYSYYRESEASRITFEHGGELAQQDSLHYKEAYIHLNLLSNRWYMTAPPLMDLYPGDYYVHDPNPCNDDVFVYTRLFAATNPETGHYVAADWTGTFHNPTVAMKAGSGFSVWVDDKQDDASIHDSIAFAFPKQDAYYTVYGKDCRPSFKVPVERSKQHRFIYEENRDNQTGLISLSVTTTAQNELTIVGNPFMASWDFEQFQTYNQAYVKPYYQILDSNDGNFITYYSGGISTGDLTRYIPPMQSVIIESALPFNELYATAAMTTTQPGAKLKSKKAYPETDILPVKISDGNQENKTILAYHAETNKKEENVKKMFMETNTESPAVFLIDEDTNEKYLDIYHKTDLTGSTLPLGIRTSKTGEFRLDFEYTNRFAPEYEIYLIDTYPEKPIQTNLRVYPYYLFLKEDDALFTTDRFFLSFYKKTTDLPSSADPVINTSVEISSRDGVIHILSVDRSPLKEIYLYDLQGRMITGKTGINDFRAEITTDKNSLYIIKVKTEKATVTRKIYHR